MESTAWFPPQLLTVPDERGGDYSLAQAKSLAKVRELQADPNVGGQGLVSQDTPTNIYFFIASWR